MPLMPSLTYGRLTQKPAMQPWRNFHPEELTGRLMQGPSPPSNPSIVIWQEPSETGNALT
jgi:hypothetical protein